jgi:3-deoxy-7-phosphoheptulonate synthase
VLIVMQRGASDADVRRVTAVIEEMGFQARPMVGRVRTAIGVIGNDRPVDGSRLVALPGVHEIVRITRAYKQASREWKPEPTVVRLAGGIEIGGGGIVVMAGPCAVENERQILAAATAVREAGAAVLRGGSFKPRSSPYSFQGLGKDGLTLLARARAETGLLIVTEALDAEGVELVAGVADVIQIGARNMQNYSLLRTAGRAGKPVLLKRNPGATIEELLLAAEYILAEGNPDVILCERGIRGFDSVTRNLLDLNAVPVVHRLSHLPIVVDPSHGTGRRDMVPPMAMAGVAAGADGLLIEVHPSPEHALSDGAQSLDLPEFARLMHDVQALAATLGRPVAGAGVRA